MVMKNRDPIRFGIMCNGTVFPAWEARCLQHLLALGGVEAALLIINNIPPVPTTWREKLKKLLYFKGVFWLIYKRLYVNIRSSAMRPVDMGPTFSDVPKVYCDVFRRGKFSEYFSDEDITAIRRYDLDFILRFRFGIIRGEILNVPRYGVWSFHHGDNEKYQGGPPCFWEVYNRHIVTGAILQRLTDQPGVTVVLHKGFFKAINQSYFRNIDAVFFGSADWPAKVCKDIRIGNTAYLRASATVFTGPVFDTPSNWQILVFILKLARNFLMNQIKSLLFSDQWNIGIVEAPIQNFLNPETVPEIRWFPEPARDRSLADPFGIAQGNRTTILVEDYDYRIRKGCISVVESMPNNFFSAPKPVIDLPVHLSYPYLLKYQDDVFCVPETEYRREVTLYRANAFPNTWVKIGTLIEGFAAMDPTVFQYEGRWWLLCTDGDTGPDNKLYAWHASDLLGPWLPHAANPLKTDVRSSRPAGTPFMHQGELYRPAQDCSETYGGAVVLNRIIRLTPTEFEEEEITVVKPYADSPYPDGLHTISSAGDITIIDGKRRAFIYHGFQKALRSKINRIIRIPFRCFRHETPLYCLKEEVEK